MSRAKTLLHKLNKEKREREKRHEYMIQKQIEEELKLKEVEEQRHFEDLERRQKEQEHKRG